jgi:replicative superfamily II helicase
MTRLFAGALGTNQRPAATVPNVPEPWPQLLAAWRPDGLRPVQTRTLPSLLNGRQHLVIMAPTNSGKSLCAHAELLRSCLAGQRAVLIEPLRVIANEQTETLTTLMTQLAPILGRAPTVRLSTGEFRTTDEFLADPPPQDGEILVVTPERLDLLLRNPDYDDFIASIGSVVVDEAQLLIDERRGRTLEGLLTGLLVLAEEQQRIPPRVVLLSATLPEPPRIADWLGGAEIIITTDRYPSLSTWVQGVTDQKAADAVISAECREALTDPRASVLVFVYKTTDAQSLAKALAAELGQPVGFAHSQMPSAAKAAAIHTFSTGQQQVLVASSALAQGGESALHHGDRARYPLSRQRAGPGASVAADVRAGRPGGSARPGPGTGAGHRSTRAGGTGQGTGGGGLADFSATADVGATDGLGGPGRPGGGSDGPLPRTGR